jgi:hypothetical protein
LCKGEKMVPFLEQRKNCAWHSGTRMILVGWIKSIVRWCRCLDFFCTLQRGLMRVLILTNPESKNWESKHDYGEYILQWSFLILQVCVTHTAVQALLSVEHDSFNFQSDRVVHKLENCPDFLFTISVGSLLRRPWRRKWSYCDLESCKWSISMKIWKWWWSHHFLENHWRLCYCGCEKKSVFNIFN